MVEEYQNKGPGITRLLLTVLTFFILSQESLAQEQTGIIRGRITDEVTALPITEAHVSVVGNDLVSVSDSEGKFRIEDLGVGRYTIIISHAAYVPQKTEAIVKSGKETVVDFKLKSSVLVLDEVTVENSPGITLSKGLDAVSLDMEATNRIPANFFDPVRLTTSFPAVVASNDQANHLVVRGNSPNTVAWRLEGMTIVNPNHTTNAGTLADLPVQAGGGVNILSGQMLGNSNFVASPFDADLGNGWSVFDLKYRDGNNESWETTLQASLVGFDVAEEGPVGNGSILANYRYSFVGLLTAAGIDFGGESISFQDLSFNYVIPSEKGQWKLFGLGGVSKNDFEPSTDPQEWEFDKDSRRISYGGNTGAIGSTWERNLNESSSLRFSAMYSTTEQSRDYTETDTFASAATGEGAEDININQGILSTRLEWRKRIENLVLRIGSLSDYHTGTIDQLTYNESLTAITNTFNNDLTGWNLQPFVNFSLSVNQTGLLETGLRYSYFSFNGTSSLEPRIRISSNISEKVRFQIGYAKNSRLQTLSTYLLNPFNESLGLSKSTLISLALRTEINEYSSVRGEIFIQNQDEIPAVPLTRVNIANFFDELPVFFFENIGEARNIGFETTYEKRMHNGLYLLAGGSIYNSQYFFNNQWVDGRFDGDFTLNFTIGGESGKEKGEKYRTLNYNARFLYLGGFNVSPIDLQVSMNTRTSVVDYNSLYTIPLDNYVRLDLSVSMRVNKAGSSRIIGLDIQNALNKENPYINYYDVRKGEERFLTQLGMVPVIYYKIEF